MGTTSLRMALQAKLEADSTLMGTLTGGVYATGSISRTDTPTAYDSAGRLKPCAALTMSSDVTEWPGIGDADLARAWFQVWAYDEPANGYVNIDTALARARVVLDGSTVTGLTTGSVIQIVHADDGPDVYDDALHAPAKWSRYYAAYKRS